MTCIVALKDEKAIYMGGDAAGVGGLSLSIRQQPKVFFLNEGKMMIGYTSSFRMGQLLQHQLVVPEHSPRKDTEKYLVTDFIDAVRNCFKSHGYSRVKESEEFGGIFLLAYDNEIWGIDSDYQVGKNYVPYDAVGCGADIALGSLYSTHTNDRYNSWDRINVALSAASVFSAGVAGPFTIISMSRTDDPKEKTDAPST